MLHGYDVNHWDSLKTVDSAKKSSFCFFKATEGNSYKDPKMVSYWKRFTGLKTFSYSNKKLYGFYHFARPDLNGWKEEAEFFLKVTGRSLLKGCSIPVLDWEGKALNSKYDEWAKNWLKYVYKKTGKQPLIYMQGSYTSSSLAKWCAKNGYDLWVAHYGVKKPKIGAFPYYAIWQYCENPDKNYFNGDEKAFKKYCGL